MSTYEFTEAFIRANDAVLNHVDAIEETRALSELIDACKERMAEIKPDAVELAQKLMAEQGVVGSEFEHKDKFYQLQVDETFEFVEKKAQYNDAIAAQWRAKAEEQKGLKASVSALTSEMKGLLKSWRLQHPKRVPDSISYTFKVLRVRQQGRKDQTTPLIGKGDLCLRSPHWARYVSAHRGPRL